jgi:hypothetical protein
VYADRDRAMGTIEASVTKLLIATKQLLESLTQWSRRQASENDVSDIYVSLGNEFNRAVVCFQNAGIDMSYVHLAADTVPNMQRSDSNTRAAQGYP